MAIAAGLVSDDRSNDPHAPWMAGIAWTCTNVIVGCLMGTFSVLIASVETRMGVSRTASSSVGGLVLFGSALIGALVGPLMARHSLRLILAIGAGLSVAGYLILATTTSYMLYVGCYMLLFGPSMAICGSVGPVTLITRWFSRGRGLALGLVHINLVIAVMPVLSNWLLARSGAQAVYLMLAVIVGVVLIPAVLCVRDHPPGANPQPGAGQARVSRARPVSSIIRQPVFWALAMSAGVVITGVMVTTFNMVPLAQSLGFDRAHGALLVSIQSLAGIPGALLFGWVADRIGGARGLALIAFDMAIVFALLQIPHLPFAAMAILVGILGLHGAGMVPNVSRALARSLGADSISSAFGLQSAVSVPLAMGGIAAMGFSFTRTASYGPALLAVAVLLAIVTPLAFMAGHDSMAPAPLID